jgi:hypothetical protein
VRHEQFSKRAGRWKKKKKKKKKTSASLDQVETSSHLVTNIHAAYCTPDTPDIHTLYVFLFGGSTAKAIFNPPDFIEFQSR